MSERITGTVKWFNNAKGYGFVTTPDGKDVFVHHSGIVGDGFHTLDENESVEFEVEDTDRGPQAVRVKRLGGGTPSRSRGGFGGGERGGDRGGDRGGFGGCRPWWLWRRRPRPW